VMMLFGPPTRQPMKHSITSSITFGRREADTHKMKQKAFGY
jgi:hypothetical protein